MMVGYMLVGYAARSRRRDPDEPGGGYPVKFRVERDVLADAVAWTARSLPARPQAPVLAGLLLLAESSDHGRSHRR